MRNVEAEVALLRLDDLALPLTINRAEYGNSYVCSPYTHYVTYCREELRIVGPLPGERLLGAGLGVLGLGLRAGSINAAVCVNNWLLSTNLYPAIDAAQVAAITAALVARFPDRALVWRSVAPALHPSLARALSNAGYRLATSRRVYLLDPRTRAPFTSASYKRDRKRLRESGYRVVTPADLHPRDLPRLVELYDALYLAKYSRLNPQFTERFLEQALRHETLTLRALREPESGRLDAVLGCFARGGVLTTPLFGYDDQVPQQVGLYRMLNVVLTHLARDRGLLLHQSSGVGHFKRSRGARPHLEFSAVYTRHLGARQRAAWATLAGLANRVGAPLLERYRL